MKKLILVSIILTALTTVSAQEMGFHIGYANTKIEVSKTSLFIIDMELNDFHIILTSNGVAGEGRARTIHKVSRFSDKLKDNNLNGLGIAYDMHVNDVIFFKPSITYYIENELYQGVTSYGKKRVNTFTDIGCGAGVKLDNFAIVAGIGTMTNAFITFGLTF